MAESNKQEKKNLVKDNPIDKRAARVAKRTAKKTARVSKRTVKKVVREVKREVKKADRTKKKETRVDARTKRKIDRKTTSASKAAGDMGTAKIGSKKQARKGRKLVKKVGQREKLEATKSGKRVAAASKKKKNY